MKPRIAAICTIVVFAVCGGRAPAQFPDCAHTSTEGQAECQPAAQAVYVVNNRTNGQVEVTIRAAMVGTPSPGTTTSVDQGAHACSRRATKARVFSFRTAPAIHMDSCRLSVTLTAAPVHSPSVPHEQNNQRVYTSTPAPFAIDDRKFKIANIVVPVVQRIEQGFPKP
jgi:hypothetical protein